MKFCVTCVLLFAAVMTLALADDTTVTVNVLGLPITLPTLPVGFPQIGIIPGLDLIAIANELKVTFPGPIPFLNVPGLELPELSVVDDLLDTAGKTGVLLDLLEPFIALVKAFPVIGLFIAGVIVVVVVLVSEFPIIGPFLSGLVAFLVSKLPTGP